LEVPTSLVEAFSAGVARTPREEREELFNNLWRSRKLTSDEESLTHWVSAVSAAALTSAIESEPESTTTSIPTGGVMSVTTGSKTLRFAFGDDTGDLFEESELLSLFSFKSDMTDER
jgi:hypothetical protein